MGQSQNDVGSELSQNRGFQTRDPKGLTDAVYIQDRTATVDVHGNSEASDAFAVRQLDNSNTPTTLFQVLKNGTAKIAGVAVSTFSGAFSALTGTLSDVQHGTRGSSLHTDSHAENHASRHQPAGADAMAVDAAAGTGSLRTIGTTALSAAAGNDARLSDARTPTAHATSHNSGGSDVLASDAAAATPSLRTLGTTSTKAAAGDHTTPAASPSAGGHMEAVDKVFLTTTGTADITGVVTLTFTAVAATLWRRLTGNITITLAAATPGWYALVFKQDATGSRTLTWTTTILWSGGTVPTWTTTANKTDVISLFFDGTAWYGQSSLNH